MITNGNRFLKNKKNSHSANQIIHPLDNAPKSVKEILEKQGTFSKPKIMLLKHQSTTTPSLYKQLT